MRIISASSKRHPRAFSQVTCRSLVFAASPCSPANQQKCCPARQQTCTPNPGPHLILPAEGAPAGVGLGGNSILQSCKCKRPEDAELGQKGGCRVPHTFARWQSPLRQGRLKSDLIGCACPHPSWGPCRGGWSPAVGRLFNHQDQQQVFRGHAGDLAPIHSFP